MNKRSSLSLIERIKIVELTRVQDIDSICEQFNIRKALLNRWIRDIKSLKYRRSVQLKDKSSRGKQHRFKLMNKHIFVKMVENLDVCVRRRENKKSHKITPIMLWSLAKKQKLKCAISGIKLTKHNISADHIIPISKGGSTTIKNIQLVERHVNMMKGNKSLTELLFYCKKIVETIDK